VIAAAAALVGSLSASYFSSESTRQATDQARQAKAAQASERFSHAAEQLGSNSVTARVGAVYSFANLIRDFPDDQQAISETLSSFVRLRAAAEHTAAHKSRSTPADLIAALRVLNDQPRPRINAALLGKAFGWQPMRLSGVDLSGFDLTYVAMREADLSDANLSGANLMGADLTGSNLVGANLTHANLLTADLTGASLDYADLKGAVLAATQLAHANLSHANLTQAILNSAKLTGAKLTGADLTAADLTAADLTGADLTGALLSLATLTGADVTGANLNKAICLVSTDSKGVSRFARSPCTVPRLSP